MRVYPLLRALLKTKLLDANMCYGTNVNAPLLLYMVRFIQLTASRNQDRLIKLLIDYGADPEAKDNYGHGVNSYFPHAFQKTANPIDAIGKLDANYAFMTLGENTRQVLHTTLYLSPSTSGPSSYPILSSSSKSSSSLHPTVSSSSTSGSSLYPILSSSSKSSSSLYLTVSSSSTSSSNLYPMFSLAEENDLTQLVATILMDEMPSKEKWQNLNALSRYFLFNHTIENNRVDLKRLMKDPFIKKSFLNLFLDYLKEDYPEPLCFLENFYSAEELKGLDLLSPLDPADLERLVSALHKIPLNHSHMATRARCALVNSEEHLRILKHTDDTHPESILDRALIGNHWNHLMPLLHNVAPSEAGEIIIAAWPILLKKLYEQKEIYSREKNSTDQRNHDAQCRINFAMESIITTVNACLRYSLKHNVAISSFMESCIINIFEIDNPELLQNLCTYMIKYNHKFPDDQWFLNLLEQKRSLLLSLFWSKEKNEMLIKKIRILCDNFPELQRYAPDLYPSSCDRDKRGSTHDVVDTVLTKTSDLIATPVASLWDSANDLWSNYSPFSTSSYSTLSSSTSSSRTLSSSASSSSTLSSSASSSSASSSSTLSSSASSSRNSPATPPSVPPRTHKSQSNDAHSRHTSSYVAATQGKTNFFTAPPSTPPVHDTSAQRIAALVKLPSAPNHPPTVPPNKQNTSKQNASNQSSKSLAPAL